LERLVTLAVPAQVKGHNAVSGVEVLELGSEIRVVAAPSVNQDEGRISFARFFVAQGNPVATQPLHEMASFLFCRYFWLLSASIPKRLIDEPSIFTPRLWLEA
jgi:hypothetical protein